MINDKHPGLLISSLVRIEVLYFPQQRQQNHPTHRLHLKAHLVFRHAPVHRVGVGKVIGDGHFVRLVA